MDDGRLEPLVGMEKLVNGQCLRELDYGVTSPKCLGKLPQIAQQNNTTFQILTFLLRHFFTLVFTKK